LTLTTVSENFCACSKWNRLVGVRNLHPAYHSVLVKFDPLQRHHDELEDILRRYSGASKNVKPARAA